MTRPRCGSFTDYDPRFFVHELSKGTQEAEYADEHFPEFVADLSDLLVDYTRRSQYQVPEEAKLCPIPKGVPMSVHVAAFIHRRMANEVEVFHRLFFSAAARHITNLLAAIKQKRQRHISVHCAVQQANDYFMANYETRRPSKLFRKLISLKTYVTNNLQSSRFIDMPLVQLQASLQQSASQVIETIGFSPRCTFDDDFAAFVCAGGALAIDKFDEISARIARRLDMSPIKDVIGQSVQLLRPRTQGEVCVIKNAVYRLLFDRLYLKFPEPIAGPKSGPQGLGQLCDRMRWLTPRELSIPEKMMKPWMMDLSFTILVQRSVHPQKAVSDLSAIQFLTNPVDIIANVYLALKAGEEFVRQNVLETRFGQFVSMFDPRKVANVSDQLSFDDFFPLFCPLFSLACPINATVIARLVSKLKGVELSPAFDFAKLFFLSALEYVKNVKVDSIQKTVKAEPVEDDDGDPLGLSHLKGGEDSAPKLAVLYA
jgi:hypothetical protein